MSVRSARPYLKSGRVLFLVFTVLLLAGCPTPPKAPPRVTPLTGSSGLMVPRTDILPSQNIHLASDPAFQAPRDRLDPVLPDEKLEIPTGLIPLNAWARLCGFTDLRVVPDANPYTVELVGPQGNLTLVLGHRFAKWNGINFGIGFGPAVRENQMVVHSLDVLKNFYPLSVGAFTIPKTTRILVLDPGHGGSDPGSLGPTKIYEKELTLDWARRIEKLLAGTSWKVVLTRTQDRELSLLERVSIADAENADLFISLHFNSLANTGGARDESGIETFCLTPAGSPSNITRGFEDDPRRVYPNNEFDSENILLATRLQESLVKTSGRKDRGVRRARFMTVIREQKRPAVLVEGGFLSSATEANLILDPAYRQQMAVAVCNALPN
jgi:N-acetylmuramoyl-L-alanine amidase